MFQFCPFSLAQQDANPVNKISVEAKRLHQISLFGVSRKRVILLFAVETEQKDRADLVAQIDATSEALRTKICDLARSGDPMAI